MKVSMPTPLLLGCIADDFTGATDLANNLVRSGMRVMQINGLPDQDLTAEVDAVVIALKSRTIAVHDAVAQSLAAWRWLQTQGSRQIYFKYCSTFDSTPQGNIGPVTEALMDQMGIDFTIATPAFPDNGRTVFKGHLFAGEVLLNESGMQNHPLTPMRDPNLVRVLQAQCRRKVGLVDYKTVMAGAAAIEERFAQLQQRGVGIAIVDAISNEDLMRLGPALKTLPLLTAGSGVAIGLAQNHVILGSGQAGALPAAAGFKAIVSGSCSLATNRQVRHFIDSGLPSFAIDPHQLAQGANIVDKVLAWAKPRIAQSPLLIYSTANAQDLSHVHSQLGAQRAGEMVEQSLAAIARGLVALGVRQLVVAGGETSGACVQALNIQQMQIGTQIDPGVPWCHAHSDAAQGEGLHLTLKSGNFGTDDFFTKAFQVLV
jgi:3-dehydrotetronate 4-kinase